MISLCESIQSPEGHRPVDGPLLDAWFELNYRLQEEAVDTQINKAFVEQWLIRLWTIVCPAPPCFWLFLARINELAVFCASRYVDCCEFAAADELLVEPCSVLLQLAGGRPLVFPSECGLAGAGRECVLHEEKVRPLLPSLYDLLERSGHMTEDYLCSVSRRTGKISQVAGMLGRLGMAKTEDICIRLSCLDGDDRKEFRSRLCFYDLKTFNELGRALHLFMHTGNVDDRYVGKYLRG